MGKNKKKKKKKKSGWVFLQVERQFHPVAGVVHLQVLEEIGDHGISSDMGTILPNKDQSLICSKYQGISLSLSLSLVSNSLPSWNSCSPRMLHFAAVRICGRVFLF
jgi:hypothetical protein